MTHLPPPRDLPPHARARIRLRLEQDEPVTTRRRTGPLITTAGLTAGVLAAVAVWLVPDRDAPPVMAAQSPTVTTTAAPTTSTAAPGFPGLTQAEAEAFETICAGIALGNNPPTPGIGDTNETIKLRNLIDDDAGRLALVYGELAHDETVALVCPVGGTTDSGGALSSIGPSTEPVTIDIAESSAGGGPDGRRGITVVAGRVLDERVARVDISVGGHRMTATLANGTYLVRFMHGTDWAVPDDIVEDVIRYDADGNVLSD